jgi:orotate phosphoribosyltransferase
MLSLFSIPIKKFTFAKEFEKHSIKMKELERLIAEKLLQIKAIKLQPANPFTWASGWKSPIYCDNRKTLSYPAIRNFIKIELARIIQEKYPRATAIAGVATGAIAQGALVADLLELPFVYIRSEPKDHGLENIIEGELKTDAKVVIIEDLVSTGGSCLKAVQAVRNFGCEVVGIVAIFTHGFPIVEKRFKEAKVPLITLSNYNTVIEEAVRIKYITEDDVETLKEWRKAPDKWEG